MKSRAGEEIHRPRFIAELRSDGKRLGTGVPSDGNNLRRDFLGLRKHNGLTKPLPAYYMATATYGIQRARKCRAKNLRAARTGGFETGKVLKRAERFE